MPDAFTPVDFTHMPVSEPASQGNCVPESVNSAKSCCPIWFHDSFKSAAAVSPISMTADCPPVVVAHGTCPCTPFIAVCTSSNWFAPVSGIGSIIASGLHCVPEQYCEVKHFGSLQSVWPLPSSSMPL